MKEPMVMIQKILMSYTWVPWSCKPIQPNNRNALEIVEIHNKGLGLMSNKEFGPGKLMLSEKPLVAVALDENGDLEGFREGGEFICPALMKQLSQVCSLITLFMKYFCKMIITPTL